MNEIGAISSMGDQAIVVTDVSGWTKTCYDAKRRNKTKALVSAFRDYARSCAPVNYIWETLTCDALTGIANHTGDGFVLVSSNVEGARVARDAVIRGFDKLERDLQDKEVPMSPRFRLRISLHYGEVWEYHPFKMDLEFDRSRLVDANGKTLARMAEPKYCYLGDAVNLACRICSSDMARHYRAACSREFVEQAPCSRQYVREQVDTDFCGKYPESVRVYGLDW